MQTQNKEELEIIYCLAHPTVDSIEKLIALAEIQKQKLGEKEDETFYETLRKLARKALKEGATKAHNRERFNEMKRLAGHMLSMWPDFKLVLRSIVEVNVDFVCSRPGDRVICVFEADLSELLTYCIEQNVDANSMWTVNTASGMEHTPLIVTAASFGAVECVRVLIMHGADVNAIASAPYQTTALECACDANATETARLLLEAGADPNLRSDYTETNLLEAMRHDNPELVRLLLEHGADPNHEIDGYTTPFEFLLISSTYEEFTGHDPTNPLQIFISLLEYGAVYTSPFAVDAYERKIRPNLEIFCHNIHIEWDGLTFNMSKLKAVVTLPVECLVEVLHNSLLVCDYYPLDMREMTKLITESLYWAHHCARLTHVLRARHACFDAFVCARIVHTVWRDTFVRLNRTIVTPDIDSICWYLEESQMFPFVKRLEKSLYFKSREELVTFASSSLPHHETIQLVAKHLIK